MSVEWKLMDAGLSICRKSLVGWKSYLLNEYMQTQQPIYKMEIHYFVICCNQGLRCDHMDQGHPDIK